LRRLRFALPGAMPEVMGKVEEIEAFLLEAGCAPAPAQQLTIVAEEILTNIAQNAWAGAAPGQCLVDVVADPRPDAVRVSLRTEDDGVAFDPLAAAEPDLDAPLEEREIGGLGIHLIRAMTDQQTYRRENGLNVLAVEKLCARGG
jgi:serine/threonine-protein kinase RsbW